MKTRIYAAPAVKGLTLKWLGKKYLNIYSVEQDYSRFLFVLLPNQISVIGDDVSV